MTEKDYEFCEKLYKDVTCPMCGRGITIIPAGGLHNYKMNYCGHSEIEDIIQKIDDDYFRTLHQKPQKPYRC